MIKLKSLITEWSSKRDPNKIDLKWIRHIQISTAEPQYIRTDHIVKTGKAMKKVDKKLAKEFDKLGSKYIKHQDDLAKKYKSVYKDGEGDEKKASKIWDKGQKELEKIGKELIDFTEKNFNAVK